MKIAKYLSLREGIKDTTGIRTLNPFGRSISSRVNVPTVPGVSSYE